jgi:tetratricopeptide (TPR) repeat protein
MFFDYTKIKAHLGILILKGAFVLLVFPVYAQYNYSENCLKAYDAVLELNFAGARQFIAAERSHDPSNLVPLSLENYIDFLTLFIGEERSRYEQLKPGFLSRIDLLAKGNRASPCYNFCLGEADLQWAFIQLKFGDYTQAALKIRKAHQFFTENEVLYPNFLPDKIGLGVTHFIGGIVPDSYKWIASLMGMDGTINQALEELKSVAAYNGQDMMFQNYRTEALYYLAVISSSLFRNKSEALAIIDLFNSDPRQHGPLVIYAKAGVLMKNGKNELALQLLINRKRDPYSFPFYYLDFIEGMARLNKLDTSSIDNFRYFTDHFRGINYIKTAWQKIGWMNFINGDTAAYFIAMKKVMVSGSAIVDEDKQALREAEGKQAPNLILLKARLLFDGGYYDNALAELLNNSTKKYLLSRQDLVEYTYRMGRIYHESGNWDKAIHYYSVTIQRGKHEPWYFAASSALQLGLLYENRGDLARADSAYHVCLLCKPAEYKNSLSQKAKAGINRIKASRPKT